MGWDHGLNLKAKSVEANLSARQFWPTQVPVAVMQFGTIASTDPREQLTLNLIY
jgi:hypothetical protein